MSHEPRRHHFLPQFYLRGFTASDGRLRLIGVRDGRVWQGTPNSVAHQRDFYRIDGIEGVEPTSLEAVFADFEGDAATVLTEIIEKEALPAESETFVILMNFVALTMARVPQRRDMVARPLAELATSLMQLMTLSEARFIRDARAAGVAPEQVDFEAFREGVARDEFTINIAQPYLLQQLLQVVDIVLPPLAKRQWALLVSDSAAEFSTSDDPVVVAWSDGRNRGFYGPALGMTGTDVTLPLSRRLALLGSYEGPAGTLPANQRQVAAINTRTGQAAARFVCSSGQGFVWIQPDGEIGDHDSLVAMTQSNARRAEEST